MKKLIIPMIVSLIATQAHALAPVPGTSRPSPLTPVGECVQDTLTSLNEALNVGGGDFMWVTSVNCQNLASGSGDADATGGLIGGLSSSTTSCHVTVTYTLVGGTGGNHTLGGTCMQTLTTQDCATVCTILQNNLSLD